MDQQDYTFDDQGRAEVDEAWKHYGSKVPRELKPLVCEAISVGVDIGARMARRELDARGVQPSGLQQRKT